MNTGVRSFRVVEVCLIGHFRTCNKELALSWRCSIIILEPVFNDHPLPAWRISPAPPPGESSGSSTLTTSTSVKRGLGGQPGVDILA